MKHWRRKGTRGKPASALLLSDLGSGLALAEPNETLLGVTSVNAYWYISYQGGAFVLTNTTQWPWASEVFDVTGHPAETVQVRVILDSGSTVTSNVITLPE